MEICSSLLARSRRQGEGANNWIEELQWDNQPEKSADFAMGVFTGDAISGILAGKLVRTYSLNGLKHK